MDTRVEFAMGMAIVRLKNGTVDTEAEAARAYDQAAKEIFGRFASLNFPEEA